MEFLLTYTPIPGIVLWIILYISDYYMTLAAAKGYKEAGVIQFEKSLELNPAFQKDINSQTKVSTRHLIFLFIYSMAIPIFWFITVQMFEVYWAYSFFIGALILMEVTIHMRHLRNLYLLYVFRNSGGITGSITYAQWFSYKISAFDFYLFSILYLLFFLLTYSFFFLGGLVICLRIGVSHTMLARKAATQPKNALVQNADSPSG